MNSSTIVTPEIEQTIQQAVRERQGILVAGRTGSGKHRILATIVNETGPDYPMFILSGEMHGRHADGTVNPMVNMAELLSIIAKSIPLAAEVQAETKEGAWEGFAKASGIALEAVQAMFPVVILMSGVEQPRAIGVS